MISLIARILFVAFVGIAPVAIIIRKGWKGGGQ